MHKKSYIYFSYLEIKRYFKESIYFTIAYNRKKECLLYSAATKSTLYYNLRLKLAIEIPFTIFHYKFFNTNKNCVS